MKLTSNDQCRLFSTAQWLRMGWITLFTAFAELPAFQDGQLVGELVNFGLAVQDVLVLAGDEFVALDNGLIPVCDLGNQGSGEFAQLLLAQT